jgi:CDP-diglyceride synthetase
VLIQRILSALVLIPIVLGLAYLGGPYLAALVAVAALLAGYEFYHIMRIGGYKPSYVAGLTLIAILLLDAYYPRFGLWRWGVAATLMLLMVRQILHQETRGFLANWALTLTGALYVGGLLGHLIFLRNLPRGFEWLRHGSVLCGQSVGQTWFLHTHQPAQDVGRRYRRFCYGHHRSVDRGPFRRPDVVAEPGFGCHPGARRHSG